jgi:hypothetical protein
VSSANERFENKFQRVLLPSSQHSVLDSSKRLAAAYLAFVTVWHVLCTRSKMNLIKPAAFGSHYHNLTIDGTLYAQGGWAAASSRAEAENATFGALPHHTHSFISCIIC